MIQNNQATMQNVPGRRPQQAEDFIRLQDLMYLCLVRWRWFVISLIVAFVLGIINIFIKPIMILFTLPFTIFTLGLFLLVINAIVIIMCTKIVGGFTVDSFWTALVFSVVLSILQSISYKIFIKE
jgi:putative membrane protein